MQTLLKNLFNSMNINHIMHVALNKSMHYQIYFRFIKIAFKVSKNKFFPNACIIVNAFFGLKWKRYYE